MEIRRQHPLPEGIILDFYCAETKVAIELDGAFHHLKDQKERDRDRTFELKKYEIRIIRFWNAEVLNETEVVLGKIISFSSSPPAPLQTGEGRRL
ncbi:MAG: DUF559 domain-containing protein [Bacteroidales bacterium]|nr:DUF559 domain-containing protein [Bacteroidales bacterium]